MNTSLLNNNTESRPAKGVKPELNPPKPPVPKALESRPVQIPTDPPDSAEMLAGWGFLLAEALSLAPWNHEASLFADRAITAREGGAV